jgi:hypothetical protein
MNEFTELLVRHHSLKSHADGMKHCCKVLDAIIEAAQADGDLDTDGQYVLDLIRIQRDKAQAVRNGFLAQMFPLEPSSFAVTGSACARPQQGGPTTTAVRSTRECTVSSWRASPGKGMPAPPHPTMKP